MRALRGLGDDDFQAAAAAPHDNDNDIGEEGDCRNSHRKVRFMLSDSRKSTQSTSSSVSDDHDRATNSHVCIIF